MRIHLASLYVDDQIKALRFYTEVLGFVLKAQDPPGAGTWLTVVSADEPDGPQLLLEPESHRAIAPFKRALFDDRVPFASFEVDDVVAEYERLVALGVTFLRPPIDTGSAIIAQLDDTCGNLIQLTQER